LAFLNKYKMTLETLVHLKDNELLHLRVKIRGKYEKGGRRNRNYIKTEFDDVTNELNERGYRLRNFDYLKLIK